MIDTEFVQRALGRLERFAPVEADVLAGMREGIVRRRRRRQAASVVGVAGAASVVALGVFVIPDRGTDQSGAVPPSTSAAPSTPSQPVAVAPAPPALPFTVGWLPDGYRLGFWEVSTAEGSAQYGGTKDFQTIVVWVSTKPRDPVGGQVEESTTIAGRPGVIRYVEADRKETQLIWQLEDGRWVMVGGRAPTVSMAMLRSVAEGLSPQPTPLEVPFGLRSLPLGYVVQSWHGGEDPLLAVAVTLCRSAVELRDGALPSDCVFVNTREGTAPAELERGRLSDQNTKETVRVPLGQEQTVDGVSTRATSDGRDVVAQLDAGQWVRVTSEKADTQVLRKVASDGFVR